MARIPTAIPAAVLLGTLLMAATGCGDADDGEQAAPAPSTPSGPVSPTPSPPTPSAATSGPATPAPDGSQPPRDTEPPTPAPSGTAGDAPPPLSQVPPPIKRPGPPKGPSDRLTPLTVRGQVVAGRRPGCREFVTDVSRFVLVGPPADALRTGDRAEITGMPAPHVRTACEGIVLQVKRVRRI